MSETQPSAAGTASHRDKSDVGYRKGLKSRHMRMIALGGAIGSGLFFGASGRISEGGPSVAIVYAICGAVAYMMLRALAELSLYRPSSGGFISHAREFMGERGAYFTGWFAFITYSSALMADITAIANYMHYWKIFQVIPQWGWAFIALALMVIVNLASVKFFGEFEFWFAMIKVAAIVIFMLLAVVVLILGVNLTVGGQVYHPGVGSITEHGGLFPKGAFTMVTMSLGVLFAYGGTEYLGAAAGEAEDPQKELPRAVNSMMWRILLFYMGCIVLFTLLLPHNVYDKNESPFVTFFTAIGIPAAGTIMNIVVMLAAASAINAELYTCGRGLRSLAVSGSAPRFLAGMNRNAVPYAAIVAAGTVGLVGVIINMIHPSEAFDVIAYMAGIGICSMWGSVMISNILFVRHCRRNGLERPKFHVPLAPYTNYVVLAVFASMIVLMWFEGGLGPAAIIAFASVTVVLALAWLVVRNHVDHDMFTSEAISEAAAETEAPDNQ